MKQNVPLQFQPGFSKNITEYESEARWVDGDKVRFRDGRPEKIGGWSELQASGSISGVARDIQAWSTLDGRKTLAVGTTDGLYSLLDNSWSDITPAAFTPGNSSNTFGYGFGASGHGEDGFGADDAANATGLIPLVQWKMYNYGEDLVVNPSGDTIYFWDRSTPAVAEPITEAPARVNTIYVDNPTPFVVALGCTGLDGVYDPMLVRWSNGADIQTWDPATEGSIAGFQVLRNGSKLVGASTSLGTSLVWSDTSCYEMRQSGLATQALQLKHIASECGLISPHASQEISGENYWMGRDAFYKYSGGYVRQIRTTLDRALFRERQASDGKSPGGRNTTLNLSQKEKVYSGINPTYNEIWWFYPAGSSEECNRYVVYNYEEDLWFDGDLDRTVWNSPDVFGTPIAIAPDGRVYEHEIGKDANGEPMRSFIRSGTFDIQTGDYVQFASRFIPDITLTGTMDISLTAKMYPFSSESITKGPFTVTQGDEFLDLRVRGRTIQLTFESEGLGYDYRLGLNRLGIQPSGKR